MLERSVFARGGTYEDRARAFAGTVCLSSDTGHAVHPNYAERHDPTHHPRADGGPILKVNVNNRYATDGSGRAVFAAACEKAGVPFQSFVSNNRMTSEAPSLAARVLPRLYRDSVALMAIASTTESIDGVARVGAVMATPANLEILRESDMLPDQLAAAPDDLVIVVRGTTDDVVAGALDAAEAALTSVESARRKEDRAAATIGEGIAAMSSDDPEQPATIATISIPGAYAAVVAERALRDGLHVFCFSDNVPISDEVRVKQLARERRLLHMGPDCGTAIIDGIPLGFANVVRRGPVGMVAASGTGAQEVSRLLDLAGAGISQLIGVGGRDLSTEVDGIMTDFALDLLEEDPETEVIVVVSKPPADAVADAPAGQAHRDREEGHADDRVLPRGRRLRCRRHRARHPRGWSRRRGGGRRSGPLRRPRRRAPRDRASRPDPRSLHRRHAGL